MLPFRLAQVGMGGKAMASLGEGRGAAGETVQVGTSDLERHNPIVQMDYYLIALVLSSQLGG